MKKTIKLNKKVLQFFINTLKNPMKVSKDTYDYYYRKFKSGYEISVAVQMVMFNRSLETSIEMIEKEIEYSRALNNYGTMALENNLTLS